MYRIQTKQEILQEKHCLLQVHLESWPVHLWDQSYPPDNVASHIPGTSVDDSLGEVFGHTGEQLIDLGTSAADAIGQGISNAADGIAGLVDHILDSLG